MKPHPLSELFPVMAGDDLAELAADIKAHGLREAVTRYDGMILDGRNRWAACKLLKMKQVPVEDYEGDDPLGFVVSKNIHRRHLSVSQRAMIAGKMATLRRGQKKSDAHECASDASQDEAAAAADVSKRSVQNARTVLEEGTAEDVRKVEAGEQTVTGTAAEVRERNKAKEIREAAKADPGRFGDLAERLKQPDAKVDTIHRELRKREKAGTVKGTVLKDAMGREVPSSLRDLFGDPWLLQCVEALETFSRDALKSVKGRVERRGDRYGSFLLKGAILKALEAAKLELETAYSHLGEARPHAVCPKCEGAKCKLCRDQGWFPKWRFTELKQGGQL